MGGCKTGSGCRDRERLLRFLAPKKILAWYLLTPSTVAKSDNVFLGNTPELMRTLTVKITACDQAQCQPEQDVYNLWRSLKAYCVMCHHMPPGAVAKSFTKKK